jgi:serine/threonine protein kinase
VEVAAALERLPLVDVDADHHFVKTCYSGSEVANLQRCAGSPFTVQLLGRSSAGQLVFARHGRDLTRSWPSTVEDVKRLLLLVIRALAALHALGVIHRDLVAPNVLLADDGFLVLCDLEGQLSSVGCRSCGSSTRTTLPRRTCLRSARS